jgi:hypothetical protein
MNELKHNPKQTAVNWVIGEIIKHQLAYYGNSSIPLYILEKGILLETEQIKEAFYNGSNGEESKEEILNIADNYYKETYQ